MILTRQTTIPIFILIVLFTSLFISLVSISQMPDKIMGSGNIFVLTSSTDKNPLRSNLDIEIAYGLENMSYVEAVSPEIFVFTTLNNLPLTIRGVEFKKLIKLEEGEIVEGCIPHQPDGALIGYRAKELLHVKIGDELTLIGAFESSVAIVNITGVYKSNSPTDDELLVSLPTARRLAGIGENEVSIIRIRSERYDMLEKLMDPRYPKFTAMLNVTSHAYTGDAINVSVLINNMGKEVGTCNLTLSWNNVKKVIQNISIAENKLLSFKIKAPNYPGNYTLEVSVGNDVLNYSTRTDIQILPKPIFVDGPQIMLTNRTYKFRVFSLEEKELKNITLEILGHGYEISLKGDSPINVKLPYPGNYTFIFRKDGFEEREMNVSVYREVPFEEVAKIEPLYNGDIIIKKGGSIRINATGDIYYSLDNSSLEKTSRIISLPPYITGFHVFRVSIIDGHSMASENFTLYIPDKYSPKIKNEKNEAYYGEWVNFQLSDQVPIRNITVKYGNLTKYYEINQRLEKNKENYTYNVTLQINSTSEIRITFTDALGNTTRASFKFHVIYQEDILPPEILVKDRIEIWGGNRTRIICRDNVAIANISVFIFGRFFNSSSNFVDIPSLFWINNTPQFMPPGAYNAYIIATDVNNNTNSSYFTIIINNRNEKIPPIIIGKKYANLTEGYTIYRAFDNVGVEKIVCYENSTLIKVVHSSQLYLNSTDLKDGLHTLKIEAVDVNGNIEKLEVIVWKNYKDTSPPVINLKENKVASGSYVIVEAKDNIKVSKLKVFFPYLGRTYISGGKIKVPTLFYEGDNIFYLPEGNYTLIAQAWDVNGNIANVTLHFIVNNSGEKIPPVIMGREFVDLSKGNATFRTFDNVGIRNMMVLWNGSTVYITYNNILILTPFILPPQCVGYVTLEIAATDVNGNRAIKRIVVNVPDVLPPEILVKDRIEIWGGNTTRIICRDNVAIANISVFIFGRFFNSSSNFVDIPSLFWINNTPQFMPPGAYNAYIIATDVNNNTNFSYFTIVINNKNEKISPIIIGPDFYTLGFNSSVKYITCDNSLMMGMWINENGEKIKESYSSSITISVRDLSPGWHNLTVYAQDGYGNVGQKNVTIEVKTTANPKVKLSLSASKITPNTYPILSITLGNGNTGGYYNLTVSIDGTPYHTSWIPLQPYQIKTLYVKLPQMKCGEHVISVGEARVYVSVEEERTSLPIDMILKYTKNLKISESKDVIYRGFEISEGNIILTFSSLLGITIILVFLGIYYSSVKGMKNRNIGVLRAIGASNRDIARLFWMDVLKYLIPSVIGGIILGYLITVTLNYLGILRAFGHQLIISPTPMFLLELLGISLLFVAISSFLILRNIIHTQVVHLMGREKNLKITKLEEVLQ